MEKAMEGHVALKPVDAIDITILVDNSIDELATSTSTALRAPQSEDAFEKEHLLAEHGYSLLITVSMNGREESLLYDTGVGHNTAVHNWDVLGIQASQLRMVVLSHGHADHYGGLQSIFQRVNRQRLPLVLHPDAFLVRKIVFPYGEVKMPPLNRKELTNQGWEVVDGRDPSLWLDNAVLVTGQIERVTDFEKGFPLQQAWTKNDWLPDTWIWDDQAVVCHVKDKGLVVLSGCSHAGTINVIRYAQRLTGINHIHAFIGGLHLTGGLFEPIIPRTVEELIRISPDFIVPGHCTGWKATHIMADRLPTACLQSNVGTRFHFA